MSNTEKMAGSASKKDTDSALLDRNLRESLASIKHKFMDVITIVVTAADKVSADRAKNMINFFRKEEIPIFGWIENMRGFFCQHCGEPLELFSSGSGSRAIFLGDIPLLGRIPIDPHLAESADAGEPSVEKYPESEAARGCDLIVEKLLKGKYNK